MHNSQFLTPEEFSLPNPRFLEPGDPRRHLIFPPTRTRAILYSILIALTLLPACKSTKKASQSFESMATTAEKGDSVVSLRSESKASSESSAGFVQLSESIHETIRIGSAGDTIDHTIDRVTSRLAQCSREKTSGSASDDSSLIVSAESASSVSLASAEASEEAASGAAASSPLSLRWWQRILLWLGAFTALAAAIILSYKIGARASRH